MAKPKNKAAYEKVLEVFSRESRILSREDYLWLIEELLSHLESCRDCVMDEEEAEE